MQYLTIQPKERLKIFTENVLYTNRGFNYYVDWSNINGYQEFQVEIHALDILIRCSDELFYDKFSELITKLPSVILLFPYLFGLAKSEREKLYKGKENLILIQEELDKNDYLEFKFSKTAIKNLNENSIKEYYDFFVQMGLKHLYQNIIEKSTLDYIAGVLVGMDSNGRKNRGGKVFELACQPLFEKICKEHHLQIFTQKQFKVLVRLGFDIGPDIADRKADFIIFDTTQKKAINFEVNFYNGTGSKPEEIIDSYINRQNDLQASGIDFALVTDGRCWESATNQLEKGFRHLEYLLNFYMLKHGMLEEIILKVFEKK
ncbi:MAG: type II restriction endonuclease [Bacteroidaceae bacterium]|nr:type II restriction endonuclease [Bacteroidaceae bacterium]